MLQELDSECRAFGLFLIPSRISCLRDIPPNPFGRVGAPVPVALVFCGVSGIEYCLEILSGNPFAGISDFYPHDIFSVPVVMSSLPSPLHGVNKAFFQILITHSISGRDSCTPWSSTENVCADVHSSDKMTRLFI